MKLRGRHWCDDPAVGAIMEKHNLDVSRESWALLNAHKSRTVDKIPGISEPDMRVLRATDMLVRWAGTEPAGDQNA